MYTNIYNFKSLDEYCEVMSYVMHYVDTYKK